VDPDEALARAREAYGDWPAAAGDVGPSPEEPSRREVRARTLRGDVAQAELVLGWRAVPPLHPDAPALDAAATVLGSGRGRWLNRRLREPGIVTWAAAHHYAPTEVGVLSVSAELRPARVGEALDGVAETVSRLTLLGPTEEELARARTLLRARWARRLESMEGRASALAAAEALDGVELLDREYAAIQALRPEEVREASARYLHPDAVSAVVYLPPDQGEDLSSDRLARIFAVTGLERAAATSPPSPPVPGAVHGRAALRRREGDVLHTPLEGVDLLVRRKPGVPLVALGLYVGKPDSDPPAQAGLGALTIRSSIRGAGPYDAGALAFAFERLGGSVAPGAASDWLGFGASVLADRLAEAAVLLDLVYREPHLGETDVRAERGLMVAEAEQVADDMFRYPFQLAFSAAYGERGYGLPVGGLPRTLPGIEADDVRSWHGRSLVPVRPVVIAVGDVDVERASDQLAAVFGGHPARPATGEPAPVEWIAGVAGAPPTRVVTREKAQAALAMAFPGPSRRDPDYAAAQVWAAVASGLGGRLFEALRERRSLAYTVVATAWQKARGGALLSYIATSPEREEEARDEMLMELERFAQEPVTPEELAQAVNYLAGQAEVNRQNGSAVAGEILEAWISGNGLAELTDPGAKYRAVTAAEVQRVAATYLTPYRRAEGVVRGTGAARPPVAALQG
jgi:zinc protease